MKMKKCIIIAIKNDYKNIKNISPLIKETI